MKLSFNFLLLALTAGTAVQASWFGGSNTQPAGMHSADPIGGFPCSSGDSPEYTTWSAQELQNWLDAHKVPYPSGTPSQAELQSAVKAHWDSTSSWTSDQYNKAQVAFSNVKADAFDTWDESRLREFLLEQGVVNPSGPREQLALLAKQKWRQYSAAASAYSKTASLSASSLSSTASAAASTALYGDSLHQASKSASQAADHASKSASSAGAQASKSLSSVGVHASKSASSVVAQASDSVARALDDSKDYVYST